MIYNNLLNVYPRYMHLSVLVDRDKPELYNRYYEAIHNRNAKMDNYVQHIDAGFDLFVPNDQQIMTGVSKINFGIRCSAKIIERNCQEYNTGYYLHPRSSIINTPLRLANSTGIIDSGYRGNIIGAFDNFQNLHVANQFDRIVQICAPGLIPIFVELVEREEDLGRETARGGGGFGSTGIN